MAEKKLLNYTTTIEPMKTVGEITGLLVAHGAKSVSTDYANAEPAGVEFVIDFNGAPVSFRLPCEFENAYKVIRSNPKIPQRFKTLPQAKRVAWRILKDWVEAQMAIVQCQQAEMLQVFLPYAIVGSSNQTLFQRFKERPQMLLSAGDESRGKPDNVIEGDFKVVNE